MSVEVPVSSSDQKVKHSGHFKNKVPSPPVKNGTADVKLAPQGVADEKLSSKYLRPLPVTATVSYKFNGKSVPASEVRKDFDGVKGQSGTVQVTYALDNISSEPISACFEGFNGVEQHQTLMTPVPILANLSVTVPKNVTSFSAPGSTLSTSSQGVTVGWTPSLFEPLGSLSQSFSVSMTASKLSVPRARLELFTLGPRSITGQLPATSATALGTAEADVNKAISAVQSALDSLQQRISGFQSSRSGSKRQGSLGKISLPKFSEHSVTLPGVSLPSLSLPSLSLPSLTLPTVGSPSLNQSLSSVNAIPSPTITLPSLTLPSIPSADFGTVQAELAALANHLDAPAVNTELAALGTSIGALAGNAQLAAATARSVVSLATTVQTALTDITGAVDGFVAVLPTPVQNALLELARLDGIVRNDLGGFTSAEQHEPAFLKLAVDLASAKNLASTIAGALTDLQQRAQDFDAGLHALGAKMVSLLSQANALETAANAATTAVERVQNAGAAAATDIETRVTNAQAAVNELITNLTTAVGATTANIKAGVASAQAAVNGLEGKVAGVKANSDQAVQNAKSTAGQAINTAKESTSKALANASATVTHLRAGASQALSGLKTVVGQDVATAAQQAQQAIQSSQATAQANAAKATGEAQDALARANSEYASLLCLNEQAELNQMPEGSATGVSTQNGIFVFVIEGS